MSERKENSDIPWPYDNLQASRDPRLTGLRAYVRTFGDNLCASRIEDR
jgi:hypothetical protein